MPAFLATLYNNASPFVIEIAPALGVVFLLSFAVGWFSGRRSTRRGGGGEV